MSDEETSNTSTGVATVAKSIGWVVVVAVLGSVIDNQQAIADWLMVVSPDWADLVVAKTFSYVIAAIMLFVGPRQQKAVSAKSVWKKE